MRRGSCRGAECIPDAPFRFRIDESASARRDPDIRGSDPQNRRSPHRSWYIPRVPENRCECARSARRCIARTDSALQGCAAYRRRFRWDRSSESRGRGSSSCRFVHWIRSPCGAACTYRKRRSCRRRSFPSSPVRFPPSYPLPSCDPRWEIPFQTASDPAADRCPRRAAASWRHDNGC